MILYDFLLFVVVIVVVAAYRTWKVHPCKSETDGGIQRERERGGRREDGIRLMNRKLMTFDGFHFKSGKLLVVVNTAALQQPWSWVLATANRQLTTTLGAIEMRRAERVSPFDI